MDPVETQHALEQGEAGLIGIAKMLGSYYKQLITEGFTPGQAFDLVVLYQRSMMPHASP